MVVTCFYCRSSNFKLQTVSPPLQSTTDTAHTHTRPCLHSTVPPQPQLCPKAPPNKKHTSTKGVAHVTFCHMSKIHASHIVTLSLGRRDAARLDSRPSPVGWCSSCSPALTICNSLGRCLRILLSVKRHHIWMNKRSSSLSPSEVWDNHWIRNLYLAGLEWQLPSQRDRHPGGDGTIPPLFPCPVAPLLEYYDSFLFRPMRIPLSQSSEIFRPSIFRCTLAACCDLQNFGCACTFTNVQLRVFVILCAF